MLNLSHVFESSLFRIPMFIIDIMIVLFGLLSPNDILSLVETSKDCHGSLPFAWRCIMKFYYPCSALTGTSEYIREQLCIARYYKTVIEGEFRKTSTFRKLEAIEVNIDYCLNSHRKSLGSLYYERSKKLAKLSFRADLKKFILPGRKWVTNKPESDMRIYGLKKNDERRGYLHFADDFVEAVRPTYIHVNGFDDFIYEMVSVGRGCVYVRTYRGPPFLL